MRFCGMMGADSCCRDLCLRTYVSPHQISREENAVQIAKELHAGDWRRCYIEQCVALARPLSTLTPLPRVVPESGSTESSSQS